MFNRSWPDCWPGRLGTSREARAGLPCAGDRADCDLLRGEAVGDFEMNGTWNCVDRSHALVHFVAHGAWGGKIDDGREYSLGTCPEYIYTL